MRTMDKPLIAIVAAIIVLVVVAIVVVVSQPAPDYLPEGEPQAAVYNYLLALFQGNFERAYGYLSPDLPGYPETVDEFINDVRQNSYQFGLDRDVSFSVEEVYALGAVTYVTIEETRFSSSDVLSPSYYTRSYEFDLVSEGGKWLIVDGERYFHHCWRDSTSPICN